MRETSGALNKRASVSLKKKKLSAIDQILLGKKKPIKVMGKPKTPIAVTGKPKLVAVSISQTCGKGQAFELDCVGKNAC